MSSKLVTAALTASIMFGVGANPALAGYWERIPDNQLTLSDVLDGEAEMAFQNEGPNPYQDQINIDWQNPNGWDFGFGDFFVGGIAGGYIDQSSNGKVRSKFRWIPDYPNDPPSPTLNLIISASAGGSATGDDSGVYRDPDEEQIDGSITISDHTVSINPSNKQNTYNWIMLPASVNDVSTRRLVSIPTNGQTEVWGPWIEFDVSVHVDGGRVITHYDEWMGEWDQYLNGYTQLGLYANSQVDNRFLEINSSIEDSFEKTYDDSYPIEKYRYQTPPNASDLIGEIPTGLLIEPNADKTITVHSAAVWDGQQWFGQGTFTANAANFMAPEYSWSWSGGTPIGALADQIANGAASLNATPNFLTATGVQLGGSRDGTGRQANSIINLRATDSDGAVSNTKFTVNWHLPMEERTSQGIVDSGHSIDSGVSNWGTLERQITFEINPRSIWWDILDEGTGLAAIGATAVFPEAVLTEWAVLGLEGANLTITNISPSPEPDSVNFSYEQYADAVIRQYNKNHGLPATANDPDTFLVNDELIVDAHYATIQYDSAGNPDAGNAGSDPNYQNTVYQSRIALLRKWKRELWRALTYDIHGFDKYISYPIQDEYQVLKINQVRIP